MAGKAAAGQKKPPQPPKKNAGSNFPGPATAGQPGNKTHYQVTQEDEVMVLKAIYGEDFIEHNTTHGAWKKPEPAFDIRVRALSDQDLAVTLSFVLVATYPKSPPLLTVKNESGLRESTKFKIQTFVDTKPKIFAKDEEEMVDRIVEGVRDILEEAAIKKAKGLEIPSLEEERAAHAAEMARLAHQEKELEERKKLEESKEEERVLGDMLQEELKRQKTKAKESRKKNRSQQLSPDRAAEDPRDTDEAVVFDQPCKLTDGSGNALYFQTVIGKVLFREGPVTAVYKVKPVLSARVVRPSLALKQVELKSQVKDSVQFKKQLQSLEAQLESLKKLHHQNLLQLLDFRIDRSISESSPTVWTVSILGPLADRGPLDELLELAGHIDVSKARIWTANLLEGLGYLHNNGLVHQDIHPGNILLCREPAGDIVPKIADSGYQRELHNICAQAPLLASTRAAKSAYWFPPEIAGVSKPQYTQKTDVWEFGIVFLQMIFGLDVPEKYHSPASLMESLYLSPQLEELVTKFFKSDPKKRPRAFELSSSEFLATNAPILADDESAVMSGSLTLSQSHQRRTRHDSTNRGVISRYVEDYWEEARIGKGGFGEVVKARKIIDGRLYAIKKITQKSKETLSETLKEVRLLSQMNHASVVRYFNTWYESFADSSDAEGDTSTEGGNTEDSRDTVTPDIDVQFGADSKDSNTEPSVDSNTGGLDFMSSSGHPYVEESDDEDESDAQQEAEFSASDDDTASTSDERPKDQLVVPPKRVRRGSTRPFRTILYISMEYCEKRTLRDLISRHLCREPQEVWRLFRQILEGLVHIHGLNIVHRDLKPENIFISATSDGVENVKIGDFGLATTEQLTADRIPATMDSGDLTRSIGTAVYVAPEVRTGGSGGYTAKVDMYSLGVIFFEMSYQPMLGMQRALVLDQIRRSPPIPPSDFKSIDKNHVEILLSLLTHNPKERPSSQELLKSGKLPVQMESEVIRRAIDGLADPDSPYFKKMLSTLFSRPVEQAKDYAWDMSSSAPSTSDLMRQYIVKDTLISIFRRHGAVEAPAAALYPRSTNYGQNAVRLLDQSGTVLQLPYDLMMGHARSLARLTNGPVPQRSYSFGNVFRERHGGGQPDVYVEVDFDIVTPDALDLALKEAEVIKVMDEIVSAFPTTSSTPMSFHLGHSDLLDLIFEHCGIHPSARRRAADTLSKLNIRSFGWTKVRGELRSQAIGVSATSIDELQRFDFRDSPSKAISRVKSLFEGSEGDLSQKASSVLAHLKEVYEYTKRFGVSKKIYISPLHSLNENFFRGGVLFACLYDNKVMDIFAAGGRYDSLIKEHRLKTGVRFEERHAVGFSMNWEKQLAKQIPKSAGKAFLKRAAEEEGHGIFSAKRCDILVASFDPSILRSSGIELVQTLWAHGISAELARDSRSPDDLLSSYRDESYSWIIIIKQDNMLKIKTVGRKDAQDADIAAKELLSWLKVEIRERDARSVVKLRSGANVPVMESTHGLDGGTGQDVHILVAQTKSKKFNRHAVVEQAQASASRLAQSFLEGPVAAIETSDNVVEMINTTSLSDTESWKKVEQSVGTAERNYVREIHDMLEAWRWEWEAKKGPGHAFVYNFRTGKCIYYDLGA
ncbi:anticodon binding domain of tRNAs-domain-containing protein [Lasiosphaeria ovina]|uniref:non-specific serine/threonine protein kinase n=1 Tax=Lasiosphaeria ovina TaxID=92902 RepID=A0AAE0KCA8_9PEZI|nr:anticodon binding domain of tRNAs-domain-containing protein [Lasiosphaeria ovina]